MFSLIQFFISLPPPKKKLSRSALISVTRLGDFWELFVANVLTKVAKIITEFLGCFERHYFLVTTVVATFWPTFGKIWATLCSDIWSHWLCCTRLEPLTRKTDTKPIPPISVDSERREIATLRRSWRRIDPVWNFKMKVEKLILFVVLTICAFVFPTSSAGRKVRYGKAM